MRHAMARCRSWSNACWATAATGSAAGTEVVGVTTERAAADATVGGAAQSPPSPMKRERTPLGRVIPRPGTDEGAAGGAPFDAITPEWHDPQSSPFTVKVWAS